jgi:hypothetical protein
MKWYKKILRKLGLKKKRRLPTAAYKEWQEKILAAKTRRREIELEEMEAAAELKKAEYAAKMAKFDLQRAECEADMAELDTENAPEPREQPDAISALIGGIAQGAIGGQKNARTISATNTPNTGTAKPNRSESIDDYDNIEQFNQSMSKK